MGGIALTGLASGMDTSAMIAELMKLERKPYTDLEARKATITSNQALMRSINTKLSTLRTAASDLMYTTAFNISGAKVSDSSIMSVTATSSAVKGTYSVEVQELAKKQVVSSKEFAIGGGALTALAAAEESFGISGKGRTDATEITLRGSTDEEVLANLMADINAAKAGVTASVIETSPGNKTLVLTADEYGTEANMQIGENSDPSNQHTFLSDGGSGLLNTLGIESTTPGALNERQAAENARLTVNGINIESTSNTLKDVVPGLTIDLLQKGSSTVTVNLDADAVADKVQAFVDAYNDVIKDVRANMAKGAALQGDSTLRMLEAEMNSMLTAGVGGDNVYGFLSTIGIEVDKGVTKGELMTGEIQFDKDKFKDALAENPEAVYNLFAYDEDGDDDKGIAILFNQTLNNWTRYGTGIMASKIQGYDSDLTVITDQMERMDARLQNKEAQLHRQFAAMERALMELQGQQSWLSSQLASLAG